MHNTSAHMLKCTHMFTCTHQSGHIHTLHNFSFRPTRTATRKPKAILDYNQHMLGVDKIYQLVSYYSFLHKSVKWWRKVFFWFLEVVVVNSYIIHKELALERSERPIRHIQYRRQLILSLSEPIRTTAVPRRSGPRSAQRVERLQPAKHFLQKGEKRRDCVVCSDRQGGTRHLTHYQCATCSDNPFLCPSECFEAYHTQRHYRS